MSVSMDMLELKTSWETLKRRAGAMFAYARAAFEGTAADCGAGGGSL